MTSKQLTPIISISLVLLQSSSLPAGTITEWNGAVLAAIRPQTPPPLLLVRNLAILHRAAFDAIEVSSPSGNNFLFENALADRFNPIGDNLAPLAGACAAHEVASVLFPSAAPLFDRLLESQSAGYAEEEISQADAIGEAVAFFHLELRNSDRLTATITYIPREEPGQWRRTPPHYRPPEVPHGRNMRPYVIDDLEELLPPGPPTLDSDEWVKGFELVKEIGAEKSTVRTAEQSLIARFWSDFSYTITPPGHWNQIAGSIAREKDYPLRREAHLFAWLNTTMMDAGVVCWEAKYRYNFWRPITAIYEAEADANPDTKADRTWNSYLESPPHPEYPSGHSSFSGAAARFLQLYFDTDKMDFSTSSDSVPGHVRQFDSFWKCAEEISWSRIYGGIHYLFSGDDGLASGKAVAEAIYGTEMVSASLAPEDE